MSEDWDILCTVIFFICVLNVYYASRYLCVYVRSWQGVSISDIFVKGHCGV